MRTAQSPGDGGDRTTRKPKPLRPAVQDDPERELSRQCLRMAHAIEAVTRRADVRALRARIVLLLRRRRCPVGGIPTRSWYVPGATARLGATGIVRVWDETWTCPPPSVRRVRDHLAALEEALVLVAAPGDFLPTMNPDHPTQRPRYPDTLHLLEEDVDAEWWASSGRLLLDQHPEARLSPRSWATVIGNWRAEKKPVQGLLFEEAVGRLVAAWNPTNQRAGERLDDVATAGRLAELVRELPESPASLLRSLDEAGVRLAGTNRWRLVQDPGRLRGAIAMLSVALTRRRQVRCRAAWLVSAYRRSAPAERGEAIRNVAS